MLATVRRGWAIAGASWAVMKDQPNLALFPVISVLAATALSAALAVPLGLAGFAAVRLGLPDTGKRALVYVAVFAWYFACTFAIVFCNSALVACALRRFAGQTATLDSGFAAARARLRPILGWSLLSATVGAALKVLQAALKEKGEFAGQLVAAGAEGVWGVATYFAVPVLVAEGLGPIEAVKRSSAILRRSWGESLSGSAGVGFVSALFALPLFGLVALMASGAGGSAVTATAAVLSVLYILVMVVVFTALGSIFRAAVYAYATTGVVPTHMDADLLQATFH